MPQDRRGVPGGTAVACLPLKKLGEKLVIVFRSRVPRFSSPEDSSLLSFHHPWIRKIHAHSWIGKD